MGANVVARAGEIDVLLADLKKCSVTQSLERGRQLHAEAVECGHDASVYVASALISMYAKCGSLLDAHQVFDNAKYRNVASWNALILGYADTGQAVNALSLFVRMRAEGLAADSVTFVAALKACSSQGVESRDQCKALHNFTVERLCSSNTFVQNILINTYANCGSMADAQHVFDSMKNPNLVSWNALILGYADNGEGLFALDFFQRMKNAGVRPDSATFVAALKACTSLAEPECKKRGKDVHKSAMESGCDSHTYVQNTLIDMYARCGSMEDAHRVFHTMKQPGVVSWNALISGYARNGEGLIVLELFTRMKNEGPAPNSVTLVAAFKACICIAETLGWEKCVRRGKALHMFSVEISSFPNIYVQSSLIDMYSKSSQMAEARKVFDDMKFPDVVAWTAMILGYAVSGEGFTALAMFTRMGSEGPAPSPVTFVAALKACSSLSVSWECTDRAKAVHNLAVESCNSDIYVQNTLIDLYSRSGSMVDSRKVFDCMKEPSVVSWSALIMGYAECGDGLTALDLFRRMKKRAAPDSVTFMAALKACSLVGALEFGRTVHSEIDELNVVLVTCLVDFYAKCGSLVEAQGVFNLHANRRDAIAWNALLAGFSSCGDCESVFELFEKMQDAGFQPNTVTFLSVLTCCSHAGLVEKGRGYFEAMFSRYGIAPSVEHCNCMANIFGRANELDNAMALLERMPCAPNDITWRTVLGACGRWKNVEIGRLAFESLVDLNDRDAGVYVVMGQLFGSRGMLQEQEMVMQMRRQLKAWRKPAETYWTNEAGEVHSFKTDRKMSIRC